MILVTGDTHGSIDYNKINILNKKNILNKNDFLIICGDFGGVWNKNTLENDLKIYTRLKFTILFVDGNHENFNLLNSFPVTIWKGGKVHKIRDNVIHLMRGQVYNIENKKIFTFGGAFSIDKKYRIENISWWKEEIPNENEIREAKENLIKNNNKVDYIITHSVDSKTLLDPSFRNIDGTIFEKHIDNEILDYFEDNVNYKFWFFGHYHLDIKINEKKICLYNKIFEIL